MAETGARDCFSFAATLYEVRIVVAMAGALFRAATVGAGNHIGSTQIGRSVEIRLASDREANRVHDRVSCKFSTKLNQKNCSGSLATTQAFVWLERQIVSSLICKIFL